jgi:dihydrofolate reductase
LKVILIAAVAKNGVIGRSNGEMPWHSKEEFQHFRNTTLGFPIIMGRKTYESLKGPLKGRLNIILTRNQDFKIVDEVKIFRSLDDSLSFCSSLNYEKAFVIGGGIIFNQAIGKADEMIISIMNFNADGDVYFPEISPDLWKVSSTEKRSEFKIFNYVRK